MLTISVHDIATRCQDPRWSPHVRRYVESLEVVKRLYTGGPLVDIGGESPFTAFLREMYGPSVCSTGTVDLRTCEQLPGCEDTTVAFVTCLEVIEHLKDAAGDDREVWTGGAVRHVLQLIYRALQPGGLLFLTTPNVTGWIALLNVIRRQHPFTWSPHPRELAPRDVRALLEESGFKIREWETRAVWDRHGAMDRTIDDVARALLSLGFSATDREDCLFVVAVKP